MSSLSIIVPVYNEAAGIARFHDLLTKVVKPLVKGDYEIIYCNDGSKDETVDILLSIAHDDSHCRVISLSRNFGKESAIFAGIEASDGQAVILIDGDGQHPVSAIPEFYREWKAGAQVVIGQRSRRDTERFSKKMTSKLFYASYNAITGNKLDADLTDYRLLDREVVTAYLRLPETDRLNRYLIDWVGFIRSYVPIDRVERIAGSTKFTFRALVQLALNTMVSSSKRPLQILLVIGFIIMVGAFLLGLAVGIEQIIIGDPLGWKFTGTALLGILLLFLVGLLLISQGVASLYIAANYQQAKQRPLYIVNERLSYNGTGSRKK